MKKYLMLTAALFLSAQAAQASSLYQEDAKESRSDQQGGTQRGASSNLTAFENPNAEAERQFQQSPEAQGFRDRLGDVQRRMAERGAQIEAQRIANGQRPYTEMDEHDPEYRPYMADSQYTALDAEQDKIYG